MAELVDAPDSKSGFRKKVQVRFLFRAHYIYFLPVNSFHFSLVLLYIPFSATRVRCKI